MAIQSSAVWVKLMQPMQYIGSLPVMKLVDAYLHLESSLHLLRQLSRVVKVNRKARSSEEVEHLLGPLSISRPRVSQYSVGAAVSTGVSSSSSSEPNDPAMSAMQVAMSLIPVMTSLLSTSSMLTVAERASTSSLVAKTFGRVSAKAVPKLTSRFSRSSRSAKAMKYGLSPSCKIS